MADEMGKAQAIRWATGWMADEIHDTNVPNGPIRMLKSMVGMVQDETEQEITKADKMKLLDAFLKALRIELIDASYDQW
jgi:hypothetical protein